MPTSRPWTRRETITLRKVYPSDLEVKEIQGRFFPDRSISEIEEQAKRQGLSRTSSKVEDTKTNRKIQKFKGKISLPYVSFLDDVTEDPSGLKKDK